MARARRSLLRRAVIFVGAVTGALVWRERKLSENQQRHNLP